MRQVAVEAIATFALVAGVDLRVIATAGDRHVREAAVPGLKGYGVGLIAALMSTPAPLMFPIVNPGQERGGGRALSRLAVNPGPTCTPEMAQAHADRAAKLVKDLDAIKINALTHDEWTAYGITRYNASIEAEEARRCSGCPRS